MIEIDFNGGAEIQHLNVRKEGEEREILSVDVKLKGLVEKSVMKKLLGAEWHEIEMFWRQEGDEFVPRFPMVKDFPITNVIENAEARIGTASFLGVTLKKVSLLPQDKGEVSMTCSLAISDTGAAEFAYLGECVMEQMQVWIAGEPDLFDRVDEPSDDQVDIEDEVLLEIAMTVVISMEVISPARLKEELQIGYNRACRLLVHMESMGIVGSINPDGTRDLLVEPSWD